MPNLMDAVPMKTETKPEKREFCEQVAHQVLDAIGKAKDMFRIRAIHLFGRSYRVNVQRTIKGDYGGYDKVLITDSYFITTDDGGKIVASSPTLVKKYG